MFTLSDRTHSCFPNIKSKCSIHESIMRNILGNKIILILLSLHCFSFLAIAQHWQSLGPLTLPQLNDSTDRSLQQANGIGRIGAIRFIGKNNKSRVLLCTPYNYIRESDRSFSQWRMPVQSGLPAIGIADLVAMDKKGRKLIAVTGDADCGLDPNGPAMNSESCQSRGVFSSVDGGKTWKGPIGRWYKNDGNVDTSFWNYPTLKVARRLLVDPCLKSRMFVVVFTCDPKTHQFVSTAYRSLNRGKDWYPVLHIPDEIFKEIGTTADGRTLYVAGKTVYQSHDHGNNWESLTQKGLPPVGDVNRCLVASSKAAPNKLFVLVLNNKTKQNELYINEAKCDSLRKVCSATASPEWRSAFTIDQFNPSLIYFTAGNRINRFEQKDKSWRTVPVGTGYHDDVHELLADPSYCGRLYASTDGGLFMSSDSGRSWINLSDGLNTSECWGIDACTENSGQLKLIAGLQDCGTVLLKPVDGLNQLNWKIVRGGDGMQPTIDADNCRIMYATDGNNNLNHLSMDGGDHWKTSNSIRNEKAEYLRPFVQSSGDSGRIYTGYTDLYYSDDKGYHWLPMHVKDAAGNGLIGSIAISPSDPNVIYVGYTQPSWSDEVKGKLFRSIDGGVHWRDISAGLRGAAWTSISAIAVNPENPNLVVVGFRGGWSVKAMSATIDQTGNFKWEDISAGLPADADVNCLEFAPVNDRLELYAGTHQGVFRMEHFKENWQSFNGDMPPVLIVGLKYESHSGTLVAGSHGAGLWMTHIR